MEHVEFFGASTQSDVSLLYADGGARCKNH